MLSFRRALIIAGFVIICIYLFQSSHRAPQHPVATQAPGRTGPARDGKIANHGVLPTGAVPLSNSKVTGQVGNQRPINGPGKTLLERLQYQYPYDPDGKFPAYIWQTWKVTPASGAFEESLRPMEASWSELHPSFIHEVITDKTAAHLIRYLYASVPEVLEAYESLPVPVLKADFFRYLILLARGGIYSDIDTQALKPAQEWIPQNIIPSSIGLIVGIEADADRPDWKEWYSRRVQFCQWTIQAKVGHPVLRNTVAQITEETLRMKKAGILRAGKLDKTIIEFTGPARWTDVIFNYMNDPMYFNIKPGAKNITWESFTKMTVPKKVGDLVVLPITSFSPGIQTMDAKEPDDEMAYVKHDFKGEHKSFFKRMSHMGD